MPSLFARSPGMQGPKWSWLFIAGAVSGITAGAALADHTERPRIIRSPHMTHYTLDDPQAVTLVDRRVVEPAAVVSNALSNQPVWPDKIELIVGDTTVYLDPTNRYTLRQLQQLPEDHSLVRAYRLWLGLRTGSSARVIRGATRPDPVDVSRIVPSLIIQKPGTTPKQGDGPAPIPNVPASPERDQVKPQIVKAERLD